jgi:hypothetical protein
MSQAANIASIIENPARPAEAAPESWVLLVQEITCTAIPELLKHPMLNAVITPFGVPVQDVEVFHPLKYTVEPSSLQEYCVELLGPVGVQSVTYAVS